MSLQRLDHDLGVIDVPLKVGGLTLGIARTAVRRAARLLALISPGPLGDEDAAAIAALGPVARDRCAEPHHHVFLAVARPLRRGEASRRRGWPISSRR